MSSIACMLAVVGRGIAPVHPRRYAFDMVQLPRGREALAPETFRPRIVLRTLVLAADTLWIGVFVALIGLHRATNSAFLSAAFFIALFTTRSMFYRRLAYTVSDSALTVRTFSAVRPFSLAAAL